MTAAGGISTTLLLVSIDFADSKRASPDLQAQFQLRQEQLHTSGASGILTFTLAHASAGALHAATLDPLPQRLMLNNEAPRKLQEGGIDGSPFAGENKNCPVVKSGPVAQLGARFHGMEEVVGSIPTRSTNLLNNLDGQRPRLGHDPPFWCFSGAASVEARPISATLLVSLARAISKTGETRSGFSEPICK